MNARAGFLLFAFKAFFCFVLSVSLGFGKSPNISLIKKLQVQGSLENNRNISAVEWMDSMVVLGSDEGNVLELLFKKENSASFEVSGKALKLGDKKEELDIEALARDKNYLYAIGSHSLKRKKIKEDNSLKKNERRFAAIEKESSRYNLYRIDLKSLKQRDIPQIKKTSLEKIIEEDEFLSPFAKLPGKENGIDIEGMALSKDGKLCIGFRSPVFRHNMVPVLILGFDSPTSYSLEFIPLEGKGIRSLEKVEDGYLIIAGPAMDGPGGFEIYFWNGAGYFSQSDKNKLQLKNLGTIPLPKAGKAEGMSLVKETNEYYELLIAFDGLDNGAPGFYGVQK